MGHSLDDLENVINMMVRYKKKTFEYLKNSVSVSRYTWAYLSDESEIDNLIAVLTKDGHWGDILDLYRFIRQADIFNNNFVKTFKEYTVASMIDCIDETDIAEETRSWPTKEAVTKLIDDNQWFTLILIIQQAIVFDVLSKENEG